MLFEGSTGETVRHKLLYECDVHTLLRLSTGIFYAQGDGECDRKATWSEKKPEGRWRAYSYDELVNRDKISLDLFWLRDESLEDSASLLPPDVLAQEIAEDLRTALEQIEEIVEDLRGSGERE